MSLKTPAKILLLLVWSTVSRADPASPVSFVGGETGTLKCKEEFANLYGGSLGKPPQDCVIYISSQTYLQILRKLLFFREVSIPGYSGVTACKRNEIVYATDLNHNLFKVMVDE